ncbi:MAG: hypothetical protein QW416_02125 [Candidatus Nitrosocaldaceae archaeon]
MNRYIMFGSSIVLAIATIILLNQFNISYIHTEIEDNNRMALKAESVRVESIDYTNIILPYITSIVVSSIVFVVMKHILY